MKNNKKGFTLAELLIVVAIIAVLVAIAIPIFTSQLEKSRQAADAANIRSAYAEAMVDALEDGSGSATTPAMQHTQSWSWGFASASIGKEPLSSVTATSGTAVTVTVDASGNVSFS